MRSITAVEIGADICALACTSVSGGNVHLWAAETLDPGAFPGVEAFTLAVRQSRRALKLPRRCRAVVWGLPDGASRRDPIVVPLIEPLTRAGFKVTRVVTPCNALGALARLRTSRTGGAMCWLGINRNGVAVVVVRPGKLLYSHSFAWDSNVGASGSQARLLQRYSLVAFLAPEVRRAIAAARQKGTTVDGIITCGNLPDLRSLTMPLIEELDIEVETLDSLEGLVVKPEAVDRLSDVAPSIRLACAGTIARETRSVDEGRRRRVRRTTRAAGLLPVAALLAVIGAAGYWYYLHTRPAVPPPAPRAMQGKGPTTAAQKPPSPVAGVPATPPKSNPPPATAPPSAATPSPATPLATAANTSPSAATPSPASAATPGGAPAGKPSAPTIQAKGGSYSEGRSATPPSAATPSAATPPKPPAAKAPESKPIVTIPHPTVTKPDPVAASQPSPPSSVLRPPPSSVLRPPPSSLGTLSSSPPPADKPVATAARPASSKPMPELLKDPVPRVTAILMSADRRLATVGDEGLIIAVGDTIGRRVVVGIDERTVLLKEPSGVQIRVALGGRVVGVERGDR